MLYWLARRDYSQQEIAQKLKLKKYPADAIKTAITQLVESNLIDENRFTENYTRSRSGKGFGPLRIMQELQARGIAAEMIAEHVQIADNAWLAIAQRVWRKHFKSVPDDIYPKQFDSRQGASERIEGVYKQYMTDDERACNAAENPSAKGIRQRAKQIRFLQHRGFTQEQIKYALGSSYEEMWQLL